jgi:hypothetical protein
LLVSRNVLFCGKVKITCCLGYISKFKLSTHLGQV